MDMMITSKDNTTITDASASAHVHQNKQEAMGTAVEAAGNVKQARRQQQGGKPPRPRLDEALKCPRCDSNNTKLCYYNNYSTLQPRYFCKACRRYWTQGGSLCNIPVGSGCRKNKRESSSSSSSSISTDKQLTHHPVPDDASSMTEHGFDLLRSDLPPFAPLPLSNLLMPAPPLVDPGAWTPSFLDMFRGGFLDYESNGFYEPTRRGMETPPPFGSGVVMQHGVVDDYGGKAPIGGEGATVAATHQGGQWLMTQVGANQPEDASVPDTTRASPANNPWQGGEGLIDRSSFI